LLPDAPKIKISCPNKATRGVVFSGERWYILGGFPETDRIGKRFGNRGVYHAGRTGKKRP
jgi:hypothetical protein